MRMKRILALGLACMMAFALMSPAYACGGRGRGGRGGCGGGGRSTAERTGWEQVAVCPYSDCDIEGWHTHWGVTYCGSVHDNDYCDGWCVSACPVEDCSIAGWHLHDDVYYCGNDHYDGCYCDSYCYGGGYCYNNGCWYADASNYYGSSYSDQNSSRNTPNSGTSYNTVSSSYSSGTSSRGSCRNADHYGYGHCYNYGYCGEVCGRW